MRVQTKLILSIFPILLVGFCSLSLWSLYAHRDVMRSDAFRYIDLVLDARFNQTLQRRSELLRSTKMDKVTSFLNLYQQEAMEDLKFGSDSKNGCFVVFNKKGDSLFSSGDCSVESLLPQFRNSALKAVADPAHKSRGMIEEGQRRLFGARYFEPWNWVIVYSTETGGFEKALDWIFAMTLVLTGVGVVFCALIIIIVFRRVFTLPVLRLKAAAARIANREQNVVVEIGSQDELGDLSVSLNKMAVAISEYINILEQTNKSQKLEIEERCKVQEELLTTKILLEQTFEQSPTPMVLADQVWRIINPAAREFLGIADEPSVIGTPVKNFKPTFKVGIPQKNLDPDFMDYSSQGDIDKASNLPLSRALAGQTTINEERLIIRKDGTIRHELANAGPIYNSKKEIIAAFVTLNDITTRIKAEDEAVGEKSFSDEIINSLPGIFYMYDINGKLKRWNKRHVEVGGYLPEEMQDMYILDWFAEEHKQLVMSRVQKVFTEGESFVEAPLLVKDGRQIPYVFTGRPVLFAGQQYLIGVGIDITEPKRIEEEKDALQVQLMQAQKMELVGRLAGGVAHDFNNMLSAIIGHAELAMMRCAPAEPIYNNLKVIIDSAQRSTDLTRQLLAFARKQTVAPKVLDVNEIVTGMLKMLQRLIGEDINVIWMPSSALWLVKIDPSQIDQILGNLCVNARDAVAGVGNVTIKTENAAFDEAYCALNPGFACGEYVRIAVIDDGSGMNKEVLDHLFEPFFTTKDVGKGTGLGLATVYGIVKQNKGFINVCSEPDKGTTFNIYLPRFAGEALEQTIESVVETPKGRGEMVLLVEDEPSILEMSKAMLENLGYVVLVAATPGEALSQAKAHAAEIELLITDVIMPEMNGRGLAQLIGGIKPGLKCLYISGYTADIIANRGVLDEGVDFLQKPISMKNLACKVREVLERE